MEYPVITYIAEKGSLPIEEDEVLRYVGYNKANITEEDRLLVRDEINRIRPSLGGKACYRRFKIEVMEGGIIRLPYGDIKSNDLTRNLKDCEEIFVFAATIGSAFDREIVKANHTSMARASILQAIGAAAVEDVVESLVKELEQQVVTEGKHLRPRYSPGFGDYVLENQRGIFEILTPEKYTGITLMDTLIMAPEKSVTAIAGIEKN